MKIGKTKMPPIQPEMGHVGIVTVYAHVGSVERAPAYQMWLALPALQTDVKMTSLSDMVANSTIPPGY